MSQPIPEQEFLTWNVEMFRTTFFSAPEAVVDGRRWWKESVGTIADLVEEMPDQLSIQGEFRGGFLSQSSNAERIDWRYINRFAESGTSGNPASFADIASLIRETVEVIAGNSSDFLRIGFGVVLARHTANTEESYRMIAKFTGLNLEATECSDFVCRVNRWKQSELIPELRLNQLREISVFDSHHMQFRAGNGSTQDSTRTVTGCRLVLDINTDAERGDPLPPTQIPELFGELIQSAVWISEQERLP